MKLITAKRAKEILDYNPSTGIFRNKIHRCNTAPKGAISGAIEKNRYHSYYGHRLAWLITHGRWPKEDIDHINGNKADNRISNLREATRSENFMNKWIVSRNGSGFKGVSWFKRDKKWSSGMLHWIETEIYRLRFVETALEVG